MAKSQLRIDVASVGGVLLLVLAVLLFGFAMLKANAQPLGNNNQCLSGPGVEGVYESTIRTEWQWWPPGFQCIYYVGRGDDIEVLGVWDPGYAAVPYLAAAGVAGLTGLALVAGAVRGGCAERRAGGSWARPTRSTSSRPDGSPRPGPDLLGTGEPGDP
jgi:hypothetical protein